MNIKNNPPRRTSLIWIGIIFVGIIIIFLPSIIGLDGFDGGFALSIVGLLVSITGIIAAVIYARLAGAVDRILQKENVLAHWTYSPQEWYQYTEKEHREDVASKKGLFILISIIAVIVGVILFAIVRENPLIIALIILGIITVTGLSAFLSTTIAYRHNKKYHGEVIIALNGVYFNRQMHVWNEMGNRLESIGLMDDRQGLTIIAIEYSALAAYKRNSYTIRIPVTPGKEKEAQEIVEQISRADDGRRNRF